MTAAYSDQDLERMLFDLESDLAERKESFKGDAPTKAQEAVCAFANDLPGRGQLGVVFIGARDDGSPSGLPIPDELLLQLADIKTDGNIVPPPTLTDSPPVRYKGRIYIRIGPRRGIASAQDERILNEKRRHRDRPFDVQPVQTATLDDLDLRFFEKSYLPAAFARDVLDANERSLEQRLAVTKMVVAADTPTPTVLGILVLGHRPRDFFPGAYIQFLRIAGDALGDPIVDELLIDGPLQDVLRRIDDKLISHNRTAVDFTSGPTEQRTQTYPLPALQQFVRNAVLHRTYEATNAPVRVYWYDDRIEIMSPGGPFGAVSAENFGAPGLTDYRNPNLAEALRAMGFVQHYGASIPTAERELKKNRNPPPEFHVDASNVRITVRMAK